MTTSHEKLNAVLESAGVSKTIYALVMPETESTVDRILDGGDRLEMVTGALKEYFASAADPTDVEAMGRFVSDRLAAGRETYHSMYREAWTQKQDRMHEEFFETWKLWSAEIIEADWNQFPFMYPTAGASEGLRAAIEEYGNRARAAEFRPTIHVFEGEYDGFDALANAAYIPVKKHNRADWRSALSRIGPHDQFYISQPSAIDGNVWPDFDEFARALCETHPSAQLMLDVTYVGCVARSFRFKADYPNIPAVFFSLSKPAGGYYYRIGGCLTRKRLPEDPAFPDMEKINHGEKYQGLFGNKWFKILLALRLGTEMMKRFGVHELPQKYAAVQIRAIEQVNRNLGLELAPSDAFMLACMPLRSNPSALEYQFKRGPQGNETVRVCLTSTIAGLIDPRLNTQVRARAHEGLEERVL
jgi:hypothetical protein